MAKLRGYEMRNGRQYLLFEDPQVQEYYDALFALGEPDSPAPFDVNNAEDLSAVGILGVNENTGGDTLTYVLHNDPADTLRNYYISYNGLLPRDELRKNEINSLEQNYPEFWEQERSSMELYLARRFTAQNITQLIGAQILVMNKDKKEYPQALKFERDAAGKLVARFEDVPKTEPTEPEPVPPKRPGGWARFWNWASGDRLLKDTMENYRQAQAQYEADLKAYRQKDAWRRIAKKAWPEYADEGKTREWYKRERERRAWIDQNQENIVRDSRTSEAAVDALRASVREDLARAFGNAEENTRVSVMLNNITINGRTLKSILCDRFRADFGKDDDIIPDRYYNELCNYLKAIQPETIEKLVSAAMAKRAHVEVFPVDAYKNVQETPEVWARKNRATPNGERLMQEKAAEWLPELRAETKSSLERRVEESRKLIGRRNRIANSAHASNSMYHAMLEPWFRKTGYTKQTIPQKAPCTATRTGLESLSVAWLVMNSKLTPQEIFDGTKGLKEKAEAGAQICELVRNGKKDEIVKLNVESRLKLGKLLDDHMRQNKIDATNKDVLFSKENAWIFGAAHALYDMDQDYVNLKDRMKAIYGAEQAAKKHEEAHDWANIYSWLKETERGTLKAINCMLGDHEDLVFRFSEIGALELMTAEENDLMKNSPKKIDCQTAMALRSVCNVCVPEEAFDRFFRVGNRFKNLEDRKQVAKWAYDGSLAKDFGVGYDEDKGYYRAYGKTKAVQSKYEAAVGPQKPVPQKPVKAEPVKIDPKPELRPRSKSF